MLRVGDRPAQGHTAWCVAGDAHSARQYRGSRCGKRRTGEMSRCVADNQEGNRSWDPKEVSGMHRDDGDFSACSVLSRVPCMLPVTLTWVP